MIVLNVGRSAIKVMQSPWATWANTAELAGVRVEGENRSAYVPMVCSPKDVPRL